MSCQLPLRRVAGAGAVVVLMLAAGCSSLPSVNPMTWWQGSSGPKMTELADFKATVAIRSLWRASVGPSSTAIFSPAVATGSVFAADYAGTVTRLDAASGRSVWRVASGRKLSGGVGADASLVVVATGDGEVIALEVRDGSVRWRARVSSEVLTAPAVTNDMVVVRSADNRIFALNAQDGKRRWVFQRAALPLAVRTPAGVVVDRDNAYAGFPGGKLVAVALSNGAARWEATVAIPRGATELERVSDVIGQPAVSAREVCAVAFQGRVACFDIANGTLLWGRPLSSVSGLSADARLVFVSDDRGAVHALDRSSGTSLWKQDRLGYRGPSAPLVQDQGIAVGDVQGFVHLLNRDTGAFAARAATDGTAITMAPVGIDKGFVVQTRGGGIFAFSLN